MKKKYCICTILLIFISFSLFSADMKPYIDWDKGYSGYAGADYVGTTRNINPNQYAGEAEQRIRRIGVNLKPYNQKLSKSENYLLWSALYQYDFSDNEIYAVTIQQGRQILQLVVVIKESGMSCDLCGGWYVWDPR